MIERRTGIPKSTAHRILQRHDFHPYHIQRVQNDIVKMTLTHSFVRARRQTSIRYIFTRGINRDGTTFEVRNISVNVKACSDIPSNSRRDLQLTPTFV
ncbi:unnamed protein product [Callosobruchus maculatus]|uniref:Uncharacterized protein n=1 Tax=Callosobruchus maculatus TaxID=64391 RepID=A0A653D2F5_CALMS|nr:unnamed protein product [Callosobruchus maculatus]